LAPSPFSSVPSTGKPKAGERESERQQEEDCWRVETAGSGQRDERKCVWRFADSEEVPFWKIATGPLGLFCRI